MISRFLQAMRIDCVAAIADAKDERGTTMVECALLASLIAVVCIASVGLVGERANAKFWESGNTLAQAAGGIPKGAGGVSASGGGAASPPPPPPMPPN